MNTYRAIKWGFMFRIYFLPIYFSVYRNILGRKFNNNNAYDLCISISNTYLNVSLLTNNNNNIFWSRGRRMVPVLEPRVILPWESYDISLPLPTREFPQESANRAEV